MNEVRSAITIVALFAGSSSGLAGEVLSQCRKFQDLIAQRGLSWSSKIDGTSVFQGEVLTPSLYVSNNSQSTLEVPAINSDVGSSIETPTRVWSAIANRFLFKSTFNVGNVAALKALEKPLCAFETTVLLPGETRRFEIGPNLQGILTDPMSCPPSISYAASETGEQHYVIHLGRFEVPGTYQVADVEVVDYACVRRPPSNVVSSVRNPGHASESYCQIVLIVKSGEQTVLLTGLGPGDSGGYQRSVRQFRNDNAGVARRSLLLRASVRVTDLDAGARFSISRSDQPLVSSEFAVLAGAKTLDAKSIEDMYRENRENRLPGR